MAIESQFHKLSVADGTWQALQTDWATRCAAFGEDPDAYAATTMAELAALATDGHHRAAVYALKDGDSHAAICQVNCTPLPGYEGPVLRVRFMTLSPDFDFGDLTVEQYGTALVNMVFAALVLSDEQGVMRARHVKFHLKSPADRTFFTAFGQQMTAATALFEDVHTAGAWLYISKRWNV